MGVFNLFKSNKKKKEEEKNQATSKFINDEWVEVTAGSKQEAIERACVALNTNESHLEIKVLSKDGKKIQARKTEVTENERPVSNRPSRGRGHGRDQNRDQRDSEEGGNSRQASDRGGRGGNRNNRNERNERNDRNDRDGNRGNRGNQQPRRTHRDEDETTDEANFNTRSRDDDRYDDESNDRSYNTRGYDEDDGYNRQDRQSRDDQYEEDFEEEIEEETDLGRKAKDILSQIVTAIESASKVELYETNKTIRLEIISQESGLFIGKFGQTLDSIQHLLKKMLELKGEDSKHLIVDAEDYRVRREESIESKARKLAKKARQERRPVSIEPMSAMDRRIVHMALKGEPGIETKSIGEGSSRRVLIVPKRNGGGRGRDDGGRGRHASGRGGRGGNRNDRGGNQRGGRDSGNSRSRMHDSYDVPNLPKNEVFGDNPEEYFENYDEEK